MSRPMTNQQTLAQMKLWGVPYKEYPGWSTRGRDPEHGPFNDVHGIVWHHTGSDTGQSDAYLRFLAVDGRSDLPAPLCNVSTDMDGDLWLIAQGRANHAGQGSSSTFALVKKGSAPRYAEVRPGPDGIDGNAVYYGNEFRYDGGQPMTAAMYHAGLLWTAAVCDFHGWNGGHVIGHKEHTGRKNDPGNCRMDQVRRDVNDLLKAGPKGTGNSGSTPSKPLPVEDDVALTDAQEKAIAKAGWLADQFAQGGQFEKDLNFSNLATKSDVQGLQTKIDALVAAVAKLPKV